jgi:hypothetical protein
VKIRNGCGFVLFGMASAGIDDPHPARPRHSPNLQVEKASIQDQRKVAEADLGPVRYLATLLGADSEAASRWFVLVPGLLLDPAAVLLLLAATSAKSRCMELVAPLNAARFGPR